MKSLLSILILILGFTVSAQVQDPCYSVNDFMTQTEGENPSITKNFIGGWNMFGYPCSQSLDLSEAFSSIVEKVIIVKNNNGNVYMPEFSFNGIGFLQGGEGYQIKMNNTEYGFSFCEHITWPNLEGCTDCDAVNFNQLANVDDGSCNYDSDGDGIPDSEEIVGCQDESACNYNDYATDIDTCHYTSDCQMCVVNENNGIGYVEQIVEGCTDLSAVNYNRCATTDNGSCENCILYSNSNLLAAGELSVYALSSDSIININNTGYSNISYGGNPGAGVGFMPHGLYDAISISTGGTEAIALKSDCTIVVWGNNPVNIPLGLGKIIAVESYWNGTHVVLKSDSTVMQLSSSSINVPDNLTNIIQVQCGEDFGVALKDDGTVIGWGTGEASIIPDDLTNVIKLAAGRTHCLALKSDGQLISWGYDDHNCLSIPQYVESFIDIAAGTSHSIAIDNNGNIISWGWEGALQNLNDIPENYGNPIAVACGYSSNYILNDAGEIFSWGLQNNNNNTFSIGNVTPLIFDDCNFIYGCLDESACNYNPNANMSDGSCIDAEPGYDCDGNFTGYEVGMEAEGGIVFYIDSTGERGLVAAMDDIGPFFWGCPGTITGANGTEIGSGLSNTNQIVIACSESQNSLYAMVNPSVAAREALEYESGGYNDWYLPSKDELKEMFNTIVNGGAEGNIGGFENSYYWSSTEYETSSYSGCPESTDAWEIGYFVGWPISIQWYGKYYERKVRVIRSFGYTSLGCTDETACNYNSEADMADGSCEYAEQGYDCNGNITEYFLGMEVEGGFVFYIDETGEHGLVAAMEDLEETYEWGCNGEIIGQDPWEESLGTGYQNTLDVVNNGCTSENGGITAAQASLNLNIGGYTDWYLPSRPELLELYNAIETIPCFTISNNSNVPWSVNYGGQTSGLYWSSTDSYNGSESIALNSFNGQLSGVSKMNTLRVRVIRTF